jgi:predicted nuclease of predicted toxin-antitoxin system
VSALLLDQGVPRSTADLLRTAGHDAVHAAELGLSTAPDQAVLDRAAQDGRIVVTLDADFHALLALVGATGPSVIRLRDEGLRGDDVARIVAHVLAVAGDDLDAGAAVSVRNGTTRVRRLPF